MTDTTAAGGGVLRHHRGRFRTVGGGWRKALQERVTARWPRYDRPLWRLPSQRGGIRMSAHFDPNGKRWYFVVDAPRGSDGKRRQKFRRGYPSERAALKAERDFLQQFGQADLTADGTVAAELPVGWKTANSTWRKPP